MPETVAAYLDAEARADLHAARLADETSPEYAAAYGEPDDQDDPAGDPELVCSEPPC